MKTAKASVKITGTTTVLRRPTMPTEPPPTQSLKVVPPDKFILAAGGERPHGRFDANRDDSGSEEYEGANDGPKEHLPRFGDFPRFTARGDEFESDEDHHENDDDRTDGVGNDVQNAQ